MHESLQRDHEAEKNRDSKWFGSVEGRPRSCHENELEGLIACTKAITSDWVWFGEFGKRVNGSWGEELVKTTGNST